MKVRRTERKNKKKRRNIKKEEAEKEAISQGQLGIAWANRDGRQPSKQEANDESSLHLQKVQAKQ